MKKILLLFSILISQASASVDCNRHKIYCKIKTLRPSMPNNKAMDLSNVIYKKSKKYNGDPTLAVAIAMQETGIGRKTLRKQDVIQFYTECDKRKCWEDYKIVNGVSDVCMFQFHVNTIRNYKMDPVKLKNDLNYCIDWHFKLMNKKKRACKSLGEQSWGCYHSATKIKREIYIKLVERYL